MRVATPAEQDRLFGFTHELFQRLGKLQAAGASLEVLIAHLRQSGVPMPAASLALRKINAVAGLTEARQAVDGSASYGKWPAADEAYPEIFRVYDREGLPIDPSTVKSVEIIAA